MSKGLNDNTLTSIGIHMVLVLVAFSCLYPIIWMVSSSLKTQETIFSDMSLWPSIPQFKNYIKAWKGAHFDVYFINSVVYTIIINFFIVLFSSMAAFAFSRLDFPYKNFLFYLFIGTMMIPIPGAFVAIFVVCKKLGLYNSVLGYVLPQITAGLPLGIYMLKTFFDKIPAELEDSARIDGCNKWQIYWHIALPLAKPAVAVIVIIKTLETWNEFLWAKLIFKDAELMPLQVGLLYFRGPFFTEYPTLMAGMVISIIPIIIIYFIMQKNIIKGITAGAIKGY